MGAFVILLSGLDIDVYKLGQDDLSKCIHSLKTTKNLANPTGGVVAFQGDSVPIVCGGQEFGSVTENDNCFSLSSQPSDQIVATSNAARVGAASLVINNGKSIWLTGGFQEGFFLYSTETVMQNSTSGSVEGLVLPVTVAHHCLERIDKHSAILIGGQEFGNSHGDNVHIVHFETMDWSKLDSLNLGRRKQVCGVLEDLSSPGMQTVVVAGGDTSAGFVTNSVELLNLNKDLNSFGTWNLGPDLPESIGDGAASFTTPDQQKFLVISGRSFTVFSNVNNVYELQCPDSQCQWKKLALEMKSLAANGLTVMVTAPNLVEFSGQVNTECQIFDVNRGKPHRK